MSHLPQQQQQQQQHLTGGQTATQMEQGGLPSPNSSAPSFDMDLSLDLEGLEPMNLEGFPGMDGNVKVEAPDFLGSPSPCLSSSSRNVPGSCGVVGGVSSNNSDRSTTVPNDFSVDFVGDNIHMDIDMTDVSDWLDTVLPESGSVVGVGGVSGSLSNLGLHPSSHCSNGDCNDPLLSANQDIFNLLNMDDDFKVVHDLSTHAWDNLDFAT